MKKFICCVAALSASIFSSGCGNDEKKVEPVDEYWIEWKMGAIIESILLCRRRVSVAWRD